MIHSHYRYIHFLNRINNKWTYEFKAWRCSLFLLNIVALFHRIIELFIVFMTGPSKILQGCYSASMIPFSFHCYNNKFKRNLLNNITVPLAFAWHCFLVGAVLCELVVYLSLGHTIEFCPKRKLQNSPGFTRPHLRLHRFVRFSLWEKCVWSGTFPSENGFAWVLMSENCKSMAITVTRAKKGDLFDVI